APPPPPFAGMRARSVVVRSAPVRTAANPAPAAAPARPCRASGAPPGPGVGHAPTRRAGRRPPSAGGCPGPEPVEGTLLGLAVGSIGVAYDNAGRNINERT